MRHLTSSIHLYSFVFVLITVVVGMYIATSKNIEIPTSLIVLTIPIYFVIAMKKFYEQGIGKTIAKFLVVSFLYNIIFLLIVFVAAFNALYLL